MWPPIVTVREAKPARPPGLLIEMSDVSITLIQRLTDSPTGTGRFPVPVKEFSCVTRLIRPVGANVVRGSGVFCL